MDVRMITQVASPGLQHGQATDLSAEIFVVPTNIGQGGGALTQQQRVKDFLVGADDFAQLGWDGESDHIVRHRQQTRALALKPLMSTTMGHSPADVKIAPLPLAS